MLKNVINAFFFYKTQDFRYKFAQNSIFLYQIREEYTQAVKQQAATMEFIEHKSCPLCKSDAIKKRFACKDMFATGEKFDIMECPACGFAFTQKHPDEKEIGKYYESPKYISHSNTAKGFTNKVYHLVRKIMLRNKRRLVERLTLLKNGKLLDYGAGTCHFAHAMQQAGWDVTAIEKSPAARELAKKELNMDAKPESALADIKDKELDVVTMWHVMEHIQELDTMWSELYRILDDTGIAIIAVPNNRSYDAQHYKEHWAAYDVPRHLWHFTPSTIMRWGERHRFILERQYTMPFDGFYISMLSQQYKGGRFATAKGLWYGFKGWLAQCKRRSASSSLIFVFRKRK